MMFSAPNPFISCSDIELQSCKRKLIEDIVKAENDFVSDMEMFTRTTIDVLLNQDTSLKRQILGQPEVAVSFNLYKDILSACAVFASGIERAVSDSNLAECYIQFAPSINLISQYAKENVFCLNTLKAFEKELCDFNTIIGSFMLLPLQHYTKYLESLQNLIFVTPNGSMGKNKLADSYLAIAAETQAVDAALVEASKSIELLAIQSRCEVYCASFPLYP